MFSIKPTSFHALGIMSSRGWWFNPVLVSNYNLKNSNINCKKKKKIVQHRWPAHAADKHTHVNSRFKHCCFPSSSLSIFRQVSLKSAPLYSHSPPSLDPSYPTVIPHTPPPPQASPWRWPVTSTLPNSMGPKQVDFDHRRHGIFEVDESTIPETVLIGLQLP